MFTGQVHGGMVQQSEDEVDESTPPVFFVMTPCW